MIGCVIFTFCVFDSKCLPGKCCLFAVIPLKFSINSVRLELRRNKVGHSPKTVSVQCVATAARGLLSFRDRDLPNQNVIFISLFIYRSILDIYIYKSVST